VTNRLEVVNSVGTQIDSNTIGMVEITVRKAPGAGNIDIGATTLQLVHSSGSFDLTEGERPGTPPDNAPNATFFNVTDVQDDDTSISDSQVLNDPADRATIYLDVEDIFSGVSDASGTGSTNTNAGNDGFGLGEGDTATVRINTQSGGTTELRLVVPETLSADSAVGL
jgi:flagellin FlaB